MSSMPVAKADIRRGLRQSERIASRRARQFAPERALYQLQRTARRARGPPETPAIYEYREFVAAGGLASYAGSIMDSFRVAGVYIGQNFEGDETRRLCQSSSRPKSISIINLKTAKALGLTVPANLLGRADEVIE